MFDDYVELDPGAAAELETALQKRYLLSEHAGDGGKAMSGLVQRILNLLRQQDVRQQQPHSDAELGGHELQAPSCGLDPITDAKASERENANPAQEALRLLLCVEDRRARTTLKQEVLQNINDDRELFTYLRNQYFMKRSWFALRSVGVLSLAQVGLPKQTHLRRY
jgi:hypothetical protein